MKTAKLTIACMALMLIMASQTRAQGPGRWGGRMQLGMLRLLSMETVQKDLDIVDEQKKEIEDLADEMRSENGSGQNGSGGQRRNFQDLSDEERQKMQEERRQQAQAQVTKEKEALSKILLESQMVRLNEIYLQSRGVDALTDQEVATKLALTDEQRTKVESLQQETRNEQMEQMRSLRDAGTEEMQSKMAEFRKAREEKVLAALTTEQKEQFAAMKGKLIELPAMGFGGGRGPGGRGGRGAGGNRVQRPE